MPDLFHLISQYFWLIALGLSFFNYLRANEAMESSSTIADSRRDEARHYLRALSLGIALPWAMMGVGQVLGVTPTVWHYFRPQDGNAFVIAWLALLFLLTCAHAWWVLFDNGAQKTCELQLSTLLGRRLRLKQPSERSVKLFAALGVLVFPAWVYLVVSMNAPLPK